MRFTAGTPLHSREARKTPHARRKSFSTSWAGVAKRLRRLVANGPHGLPMSLLRPLASRQRGFTPKTHTLKRDSSHCAKQQNRPAAATPQAAARARINLSVANGLLENCQSGHSQCSDTRDTARHFLGPEARRRCGPVICSCGPTASLREHGRVCSEVSRLALSRQNATLYISRIILCVYAYIYIYVYTSSLALFKLLVFSLLLLLL